MEDNKMYDTLRKINIKGKIIGQIMDNTLS